MNQRLVVNFVPAHRVFCHARCDDAPDNQAVDAKAIYYLFELTFKKNRPALHQNTVNLFSREHR